MKEPKLGEFGFAGDDHVVPFEVAPLDVRGRIVQLGPTLNHILARHDYPEPVARLLAEAMVLTVLLGTALKFEGKFILQTRSDGPVDMLVVDLTTPSAMRAYARFDADRLAEFVAAGSTSPSDLLGTGVLAMTIDQGEYMQRYQGIVELAGQSLDEVARTYFRQSEQIPTDVRMAVARHVVPGEYGPDERWRAGGMLIQFLPEAPERMRHSDLHGGDGDNGERPHSEGDAWAEARMLVDTIDADELTDPQIGAERLLYRLFHERGVRVYEPHAVYDRCSCSRDKIKGVLSSFSQEEIDASQEDGAITVTCEFCSTVYRYEATEVLDA